MGISLEICLQMFDWVLTNGGVLTFLELTNASRDVCIIYMLPVRVFEQKHRVRRRLTLKKRILEGAARWDRPHTSPHTKQHLWVCVFKESRTKRKKNLRKSLWPLCDLYISILHALQSVHTYTLQHICHGFSSRQGNWFVQNALIFGSILRYIDLKKNRDLFFRHLFSTIFLGIIDADVFYLQPNF